MNLRLASPNREGVFAGNILAGPLSSLVGAFESRGLGSVPATVVTVLIVSAVLGTLSWSVKRQVGALMDARARHRATLGDLVGRGDRFGLADRFGELGRRSRRAWACLAHGSR